jgi:tripartite-type tricarboxylate transporter receptor subunit TctC
LKRTFVTAAAATAAVFSFTAMSADIYPSKSIRIVHGYANASSMDINARNVGNKLAQMLGQQVIVDSRPGGTGVIANDIVAKSPADGYTLLAAPSSAVVATPHLQKVPFDTFRDFAPVALIGEFANLVAAHPAVPAKTAKDLIALARTRPGRLSYGSNGVGSGYHLAGVLFCMMAGVDMLHVPYRGGGSTAIGDLVTGRVDLMWNNPVFLVPHVRNGKIKAIGVTGFERLSAIPDVPTIAESGLPRYEMIGWQGILAPAATPKDIIARLNGAVAKIMSAPDIKELWKTQGIEAVARTTEQFGERMRADYEKYGTLIRKLGTKID